MRPLLVLTCAAGLTCNPTFTAPSMVFAARVQRTLVTDSAAAAATQCARGFNLQRPYRTIRLYLVRGRTFDLQGRWSEGDDLPYTGFALKNRVYVATDRQDVVRVWAHEFLHAMYGLPGSNPENHHPLFQRCGLLVI